MRGEQEQICFDRIKKQACKKGDMRLSSIWESAVANSDSNAFPDFVCPNGFIEHFQVTTANETKKGSKHNIAENVFERDSEIAFEQESKEFLRLPPRQNAPVGTYGLQVTKHIMPMPDYSHENFIHSFKRNFEKHIGHLQKYNGDKAIGVFLIELVGAHITIEQNGRYKESYHLTNDYNLLSYIYDFAEQVHYVVFADGDDYELIETRKIPTMLRYIPQNISCGVGRYLNIKLNLFIDL